jgi:integrase
MASVFKKRGRGYWIVRYTDGSGKRREHSTGTTDRQAASRIAAKLEADAALRRDGVIDLHAERYAVEAKRPIQEHVADFERSLQARGNTPQHVALTLSRVRVVLDGAGCTSWSNLDASRVEDVLRRLRGKKRGPASVNHYRAAVRAFSAWMAKIGRTIEDPLRVLRPLNEAVEQRRERRVLSPEDLRKLLRAAENGPVRQGLAGPTRALLYRLATETGLRAREIASLRVGSFDLKADPPTVRVAAAYSKRRREDTLPLRPSTAAELSVFLRERLPSASAFGTPPAWRAAEMLKEDLESVEMKYKDDEGRFADFHSLRHGFITNLAQGGVSPKVAQALARHSSIVLTYDRYTHLRAGDDQVRALEVLPDLSTTNDAQDTLRATGSAGEMQVPPPHQIPHHPSRTRAQADAGRRTTANDEPPSIGESKCPTDASLRNAAHEDALVEAGSGGGIRTPDTRIMIPLL